MWRNLETKLKIDFGFILFFLNKITMKSYFIKIAIILNCTINIECYGIYMSIADKSYNIKYNKLFSDSYLDLKQNGVVLSDTKICEICKERINVKREIPYNCTIPLGCPFNINKKNIIKG